jgi:hypothetical protein
MTHIIAIKVSICVSTMHLDCIRTVAFCLAISSVAFFLGVTWGQQQIVRSGSDPCPLVSPSTATSTNSSSYRCFVLPDYTEWCLVQNVCWVNNELVSTVPLVSVDDSIDWWYNYPSSRPARRQAGLPARSFIRTRHAVSLPTVSTWVGLGYVTGFDAANLNPFHFAESLLVWLAVRDRNDTLFLPTLDVALLDR